MADCLLVPIHIEALFLCKDKAVTEASEDFIRLPYCNGERDINSNIGYISEEIVSQPFQNQNLYLRVGVHLHWFLPSALTRDKKDEKQNKVTFPRVPDRWLVTRSGGSKETKQWVVESDYLHPEGEGEGSIAFPLPLKEPAAPYRRLGRNIRLDEWLKSMGSQGEYLNQLNHPGLTAVGYGLPTFAAFYPNCYSVFGFYDDEINDRFPEDLTYSVIGWYSHPADDDFLRKYLDQPARKGDPKITDMLEKDLGWHLPEEANNVVPRQLFCYGVVSKPIQAFKASTKKVAVANSGVEALSAYLADEINGEQGAQKDTIEEQLEFLSIQSKLINDHLDLDAKFWENEHEGSFNAVYGGSQWTIQLDVLPGIASESRQEKEKVKLPLEIAGQISDLNRLQRESDRMAQEITDMRRQLFSDWYKYMLCVYPPVGISVDYPDMDEVRHFIETQDIALLKQKVDEKNRLTPRLELSMNHLKDLIAEHNQQKGADLYILKAIPAARYWQPKEPVVLVADEGEPVFLQNRMANLNCLLVKGINSDEKVTKATLDIILKNIKPKEVASASLEEYQPWPVFLEWEVEFFPMNVGGNVFPTRDYQESFITNNFALNENAVELQKRSRQQAVRSAQIYNGYSILTPHAGIQLKQNIAKYLQIINDIKRLKELFHSSVSEEDIETWYKHKPEYKPKATENDVFQKWLGENIESVCDWYNDSPKARAQPDPISTFLRAFKTMQNRVFLSQALSGFNDALLMRKQTIQLPIADPLGFAEYQSFADQVAAAIDNENKSAPQPLDDFNPIRAGTMKILHLRLVDTFGRVKELPCEEVVTTKQMHDPSDKQNYAWLPPRLVQPARLNFRWLAADSSTQARQEMNAHPATHPICGWLLPNFLDNSLMVYDQAGIALGSLTSDTRSPWQPALDSKTTVVKDIANPYLREVVEYISAAGKVNNFIDLMENALDNIIPDHSAESVAMTLLMGRPIAVVRASLELELLGRPAVHQGWSVFRKSLEYGTWDNNAFEAVRFPIRLGEQKQLNDGLICYWLEDERGAIQNQLRPPIELSINDPPRTLTMLLDPLGKVHATSGILPVKAIDIPPNQYSNLLQNLAVTFLAAPILTNQGQVNLPVPVEPGYGWAWLEARKSTLDKVNPPNPQEAFAAPQEIREGWLKLTPEKK